MKATAVIGLGNPLMSDDGVGIHLVRRLQQEPDRHPGVEFLDLGTSGMEILHTLAGRPAALLIDCAVMGEEAGTIRRFEPSDVRSNQELPRMSLHEGDLLQILALSKQLGECPDRVVIFGIEPADLGFGERLSPVLEREMPHYEGIIRQELQERG